MNFTDIDLDELEYQLVNQGVSGCTCMTKTPGLKHHQLNCKYRVVSEALLAIKHFREIQKEGQTIWRELLRFRQGTWPNTDQDAVMRNGFPLLAIDKCYL